MLKYLIMFYIELKNIYKEAKLAAENSQRQKGVIQAQMFYVSSETSETYCYANYIPEEEKTTMMRFQEKKDFIFSLLKKKIIPIFFFLKFVLKRFLDLPRGDQFCFFIIFVCFFIIFSNLYFTFKWFYEGYVIWKNLFKALNLSEYDMDLVRLFILEIPEFYYLRQFELFIYELTWKFFFAILIILPILLIVAYSTLLEWKMLSAIQRWRGPNKVGIKGSAQPLIDGVKLILKEIIVPVQSENKIFILASIWSIFCMLLLWFIVPTSRHGNVIQFNYELLILFCVSVLGSISIVLAGWSSNSKYAFLGGVWAGAQMISYELVLGLIALIVMTVTETTQIVDIVAFQEWNGPLFLYLPMEATLFLIITVAETNRAPFDFAEAESELVSGYNTEYSGLPFAFFFIAEYGNILYMSLLASLLFLGGWSTSFLPLFLQGNFWIESVLLFSKTIIIYHFFLWLRGALPWYWYDQLMSLCWKIFLPVVLISLIVRILFYFF